MLRVMLSGSWRMGRTGKLTKGQRIPAHTLRHKQTTGNIGGSVEPEEKYADDKIYSGNCPFLKYNQKKYTKEKEDAMRKEKEETEKVK